MREKENEGVYGMAVGNHMARFTTAEAQAIVHAVLTLFRLEFTVGAKKVCNVLSKRGGKSFGRSMGLQNSDIRRCMTAVSG